MATQVKAAGGSTTHTNVRFSDVVKETIIDRIPEEDETVENPERLEVVKETIKYEHALLALHCSSMLFRSSVVTAGQRGFLKDLIVRSDERVMAACALYSMDGDVDELLDTLRRLALALSPADEAAAAAADGGK